MCDDASEREHPFCEEVLERRKKSLEVGVRGCVRLVHGPMYTHTHMEISIHNKCPILGDFHILSALSCYHYVRLHQFCTRLSYLPNSNLHLRHVSLNGPRCTGARHF